MKLSEFLKYDTPEKRLSLVTTEKCVACDGVLDECVSGINNTSRGLLCDDCYYDMMGSLVEEFPIGSHRRK